jgi:hypothetical protein
MKGTKSGEFTGKSVDSRRVRHAREGDLALPAPSIWRTTDPVRRAVAAITSTMPGPSVNGRAVPVEFHSRFVQKAVPFNKPASPSGPNLHRSS